MGALLAITTANWVGIGGLLIVGLVSWGTKRAVNRTGPAIAAGLAALLLFGVITYYVTP